METPKLVSKNGLYSTLSSLEIAAAATYYTLSREARLEYIKGMLDRSQTITVDALNWYKENK